MKYVVSVVLSLPAGLGQRLGGSAGFRHVQYFQNPWPTWTSAWPRIRPMSSACRQNVGQQESASREAAERLQQQDRTIAQLRQQLKAAQEASKAPAAGH